MNERILVVDDSPTARAMISRIIGGSYSVETASSGSEALEAIQASPPDLILLDLLMPGMDGLEVLARLRDRASRVPVLVLSADIQSSTRQKALELGALDLINKPPRPAPLHEAIERSLGRPASP
jgi:CheY-like chemotaxis protein